MLTYKAIVIAVVASTAFAVQAAEFPLNVESGPQPAPSGVKDPVPTPANFKFAEIPAHGGPECNPQTFGITGRVRGS